MGEKEMLGCKALSPFWLESAKGHFKRVGVTAIQAHIIDQLIEINISNRQIGIQLEQIGVKSKRIPERYALRVRGIRLVTKRKKKLRICKGCGIEFYGHYRGGKEGRQYHSRECAWMHNRIGKLHVKARSCRVYFYLCKICGKWQINRIKRMSSICDSCMPEYKRMCGRDRELQGYNSRTIICKECGIQYTTEYADKRREFCSNECSLRFSRRVCKGIRRARKKGTNYEPINKKFVYERDQKRCQACGVKVKFYKDICNPRYAQLDHIIPLSKGGTHTYNNVQILCRSCNINKGNGAMRDQLRLY